MVAGNTQHRYKAALALLEDASPGTKQQMYFGFLKKAASRFGDDADGTDLVACVSCGAPTLAVEVGEPHCSFCKTKTLALARKASGETRSRASRRRTRR